MPSCPLLDCPMIASHLNSGRFLRLTVLAIPSILLFFYILHMGWEPLHSSTTTQPAVQSPPAAEQTADLSIPSPNSKPESSDYSSSSSSSPSSCSCATSSSSSSNSNEIHNNNNNNNYTTAIRGIPDKVWQSSKTNLLESQQQDWVHSWTQQNPYHRHELLTDQSAETFVRSTFAATRPDIVDLYTNLPIPILRADLLRYLLVLAEGGVWSDLDVTCEKPVGEWVPAEYRSREIDMIVGLEFDMQWLGEEQEQVSSQFCNWVFAARPGSRHLQAVVDAVVETLRTIAAENNVPIQGLQLEMLSDVVDVTGPKIMTIWALKSLSRALNRLVDDRDFHAIKQPKLIGDLLIMPGNSFAAAQNGFPEDQSETLVSHHYWGSWKDADKLAKEHKKKLKEEQEQEQKAKIGVASKTADAQTLGMT